MRGFFLAQIFGLFAKACAFSGVAQDHPRVITVALFVAVLAHAVLTFYGYH